MFTSGRTIIDRMGHAISRSLAFSDLGDTDVHNWLSDNPDVHRPSQLPNDFIPALLVTRIYSHETHTASWSIPAQQHIDFETPSQVLGIEGVLISSSIIYTLAFRTRQLSYPMPDYNCPDFHPTLTVEDSISIAFLSQRMVSSRIDGYALSDGSFLRAAANTFGHLAEGTALFPHSDELFTRYSGRIHLSPDCLLTDFRRFSTPLESFSGFMATIQVVYRGLGLFRICSLHEAVLSVTETFFGASRIPAQLTAWAICETAGCPPYSGTWGPFRMLLGYSSIFNNYG